MSLDNDEDEDYMSDKYLLGSSENDIRPGLPNVAKEKRALENYKKKIASAPIKKEVAERLRLEEGLNTAISKENKGFKMLEKMGYQPGMSLGKSSDGIKEPINVLDDLNSERLHPKKKLKVYPKFDAKARDKDLEKIAKNYRQSNSSKRAAKLLHAYYNKARSACYNLDQSNGIDFPEEESYWPKYRIKELQKKEKEDDEDSSSEEEEEIIDVSENLLTLNSYIRSKYYFCVFCASQFESLESLEEYCPGASIEDHDL